MDFQHRGHRGHRGNTEGLFAPLTRKIIGCAMEVHSALGPGLLESVYEACLCHELFRAGLRFERQVPIPVRYKEFTLECGFRLDLLVEDAVVVEVKSVERIHSVHETQLFTYLKVSRHRVGLLLNFNVAHMRHGITRRIL